MEERKTFMPENNSSKEEQNYVIPVLKVLMEKKELAIKEFFNTDLNTPEQLSKINIWYNMVIQMVKKDPPVRLPRRMKIYEDKDMKIMRIEYDYDLIPKEKYTPSIIILSEL